MTTQQLMAYRMKLEGRAYSEIAAATKFSEYTLRKYFANGGRWHNGYKKWKTTELTVIHNSVHDMFRAHAKSAFENLVKAMHSENPAIALKAAQDILDRSGFAKSSEGFNTSSHADPAESVAHWFEQHMKDENDDKTNGQGQR